MKALLQLDRPLEKVVFGKLYLPWISVHPDIYTISPYPTLPSGIYPLLGHNTLTHPNVWEIANVPGHTGILIHIGNYACDVHIGNIVHPSDSKGCILVGFGIEEEIPMVTRSRECADYLRTTIGIKSTGQPMNIQLEIREFK